MYVGLLKRPTRPPPGCGPLQAPGKAEEVWATRLVAAYAGGKKFGAEEIARLLPTARVVKTFNTIFFADALVALSYSKPLLHTFSFASEPAKATNEKSLPARHTRN
jgi:hypothetical protein